MTWAALTFHIGLSASPAVIAQFSHAKHVLYLEARFCTCTAVLCHRVFRRRAIYSEPGVVTCGCQENNVPASLAGLSGQLDLDPTN
ncbi:hypothetical protein BC826DRAFT_1010670 [Russula brevipes]|nr:hypothetical protein BC826DRAFT_1010670 [Russula brevipes]